MGFVPVRNDCKARRSLATTGVLCCVSTEVRQCPVGRASGDWGLCFKLLSHFGKPLRLSRQPPSPVETIRHAQSRLQTMIVVPFFLGPSLYQVSSIPIDYGDLGSFVDKQ